MVTNLNLRDMLRLPIKITHDHIIADSGQKFNGGNISKFIINGQKTLHGELSVYGAKNAALKMIAACILIDGAVILRNIPDISDIAKVCLILEKMGAKIERSGHELSIDARAMSAQDPDPLLVKSIRSSVVLIGPILARFGQVRLPHPGGDKIGQRPIDRHIKAFADLGVETTHNEYEYIFRTDRLRQNHEITFDKITVNGTENIILFAAKSKAKVVINNAATEPEIVDLIEFLNHAGGNIKVQDRTVTVNGVAKLRGLEYSCIPDRLEAATFAVLAAATNSEIKIRNCSPEHLKPFLNALKTIGAKFKVGSDYLHILASPRLKAIDIETAEWPGFSTDWQPPLGVLLTQAKGKSTINERVFENRLGYLEQLQTMGANINILNSSSAEITGPTPLKGRVIESLDIRAGATLIVAGLIASGTTTILEAENIDRGYEKIEERLAQIGADIKRID